MFKLKKNMGTLDRSMRVIAGSTLLIIGPLTDLVPTDTFSNVILTCMGLVALSSALVSYCVLYEFTGFDTSDGRR
jgi:hypothetical protein